LKSMERTCGYPRFQVHPLPFQDVQSRSTLFGKALELLVEPHHLDWTPVTL
jgi:hypothetical protein